MSGEQETQSRKWPRAEASGKLRYWIVQPPEPLSDPFNGSVMNVSRGGMAFLGTEATPVDSVILAELSVASLPGRTVACMARVVWCEDSPASSQYNIGAEFWWIGWADPAALDVFAAHTVGS